MSDPLAEICQSLSENRASFRVLETVSTASSDDERSSALEALDARQLNLERIRDIAEEQVRELKTFRNTLVPIAKIPTDVLSWIFELVALSAVKFEAPADLFTITHVSSSWRNLAVNRPALWRVPYFGTIDSARTMLERAKNLPIEIQGTAIQTTRDPYPGLRIAFENLHRAEKLSLRPPAGEYDHDTTSMADHMLEPLDTGLQREAPLLQMLEIYGTGIDAIRSLPGDLFRGKAPQLRVVTLEQYNLEWTELTVKAFQSLRSLTVNWFWHDTIFQFGTPPQLPEFLGNLARLPHLEHLDLRRLFTNLSDDDMRWSPTEEEVTCPKLRSIHLTDEMDVVQLFFRRLRCPQVRTIAVAQPDDYTYGPVLRETLAHCMNCLYSLLSEPFKTVHLAYTTDNSGSSVWGYSMHLTPDIPQSKDFWRIATPVSLTFTGTDEPSKFASLCCNVPADSIEVLRIGYCEDPQSQLFKHFGQSTLLTVLILEHGTIIEEFTKFLTSTSVNDCLGPGASSKYLRSLEQIICRSVDFMDDPVVKLTGFLNAISKSCKSGFPPWKLDFVDCVGFAEHSVSQLADDLGIPFSIYPQSIEEH